MKKLRIILITAICLLCFASCQSGYKTQEYTYSDTMNKVSIRYPVFSGKDKAGINDTIYSNISDYVSENISANQDIYIENNFDYSIAFNSKEITSIVFEGISNSPTASHPSKNVFTVNLFNSSRDEVKINDFIDNYDMFIDRVKAAIDSGDYSDEIKEYLSRDYLSNILIDIYSVPFAVISDNQIELYLPVPHVLGDYQTVKCDTDMSITDILVKRQNTERYVKIYTGETQEDHFYYYYDLFDKSGALVDHKCTYMDEPDASMPSDDIIKISVQAGTGLSTRWTYYYDLSSNMFSPTFYHVLAEKENMVAFYNGKKIVVTDMFDEGKIIKEIDLKQAVSDITDPIESVTFSDDLSQIYVTYLSGTELETISETVLLK